MLRVRAVCPLKGQPRMRSGRCPSSLALRRHSSKSSPPSMFHFHLNAAPASSSSAPLSVAEALTDRNAMAQCADALGSPFSVPHRDTSCASGPRARPPPRSPRLPFAAGARQPAAAGGRQQPAAANAVPRATPTAIDWSALSSVPIRRPRAPTRPANSSPPLFWFHFFCM